MSAARYKFATLYTSLLAGFIGILIECISAKFPCMNDGTPVLTAHNSEFKCECKRNFYGPFCEYDSATKNDESVDRQIIKVVLCVFFLLLLPTLIIYLVRTLYLFLKRCGEGRTSSRGFSSLSGGNANGCENSPYGTVFEAAANIVLQQQQQQQQLPQQQPQFPTGQCTFDQPQPFVFEENTFQQLTSATPTITLLPLFNFPTDATSTTTRHRSGRGLRRTRTAAGAAVAIDAADATCSHRALHATRSLVYGGGGATFTMEEFSQLLRGLQSVRQPAGELPPPPPPSLPPPPYDSAISNNMSFI